MFKNEDGVYENRNMWNVNDASMVKYAECHARYSGGRTEVIGFIYLRVNLTGFGMGACE